MEKKEVLNMVGKRVIVVAREKLEEISASFVERGYSGILGYSGSSGISGFTGYTGAAGLKPSDDKFALKLAKVKLISFDEYLIKEVTDDCIFVKVVNLCNQYNNIIPNGVWYTTENFFDAFNILKVLDYKREEN